MMRPLPAVPLSILLAAVLLPAAPPTSADTWGPGPIEIEGTASECYEPEPSSPPGTGETRVLLLFYGTVNGEAGNHLVLTVHLAEGAVYCYAGGYGSYMVRITGNGVAASVP